MIGDTLNNCVEDLYNSIAQTIFAAKPAAPWRTGTYLYQTIRLMTKGTCRFALVEGGVAAVTPGVEVIQAFETLRTEMARLDENNHAWYTAKCHVTPEVAFSFEFDYDHLPAFDIAPSPSKWVDEFKHYPRPALQAQVQDWIDGTMAVDDFVRRLANLHQPAQHA